MAKSKGWSRRKKIGISAAGVVLACCFGTYVLSLISPAQTQTRTITAPAAPIAPAAPNEPTEFFPTAAAAALAPSTIVPQITRQVPSRTPTAPPSQTLPPTQVPALPTITPRPSAVPTPTIAPTVPVDEPTSVSESVYVQLTSDNVPILFDASDSALQIAIGSKGDVFEIYEEYADWFGINMFSGEERYFSKAQAMTVPYSLSLPSDVGERKLIFLAFLEAEDRATAEAEALYPQDKNLFANIDYERILNDRYKLDVTHRFKIPPISYRPIANEGATAGWW